MRSKDFAKASGLAVVFDLTAHTFYLKGGFFCQNVTF